MEDLGQLGRKGEVYKPAIMQTRKPLLITSFQTAGGNSTEIQSIFGLRQSDSSYNECELPFRDELKK